MRASSTSQLPASATSLRAHRQSEQALWRDQLFVRARVHLLLTQDTDEGVDRQYELLRRASPYHQIVLWGPSLMAKAYVAKRAQEAAGQ